jgi:hypothetical protein
MTPAQGIAKLGFRRWYERQLIQGHVHFVTCFMSLILVITCLEQIDWRAPLSALFMLALVVGGGVLCVKTLRWYNFLLARAECLGAQSNCARCSTYGVLQVLSSGIGNEPESASGSLDNNSWIRVRCKKCGHEWRMDNT